MNFIRRFQLLNLCPRNTYSLYSSSSVHVNSQEIQSVQLSCPPRQWTLHQTVLQTRQGYSHPSHLKLNQAFVRQITSCYSTSIADDPSVHLFNNGSDVMLKFNDKNPNSQDSLFHATWLRHVCQCPACAFSSGQRMIDPTDLVPSLVVESAEVSGSQLKLSWSGGHHGHIDIDWLRKNAGTSTDVQNKEDPSNPSIATELPVLNAEGLLEDKMKQWRWLEYLNDVGVCLLTNLGTEVGTNIKLGELMYNVQPTIYGKLFTVKSVPNAINIAYSSQELGLHMDLVYYESPPGLQLLHCLRFDSCVEGGESVLLDMFPVVEELREKFPEHFKTLTRVPATFQKIHYDRELPVHMVKQCPHIELDENGKVVEISWSPPFEGPLSIPHEDLEPYYQAYYCLARMLEDSKYKLEFRLQPGEAITFNNRRVLHSRKEFKLNGGVRWLEGAYVNIDEFKSTFQVLCNQVGKPDYPVRRVFNGNST